MALKQVASTELIVTRTEWANALSEIRGLRAENALMAASAEARLAEITRLRAVLLDVLPQIEDINGPFATNIAEEIRAALSECASKDGASPSC